MNDEIWNALGDASDARLAVAAYRALIDQTRDIILLMTLGGSIVFCNLAAEGAYGMSREALMSRSIQDLRAPDTVPEVIEQIRLAAEHGVLFETSHVRADGSIFPVEVSSRGIDISGSRYILSQIRDISARRSREREREVLVDDLKSSYRQLEGLLEIVSSTVGHVDLRLLVAGVLDALRGVMGAQAALFFVLRDGAWVLSHQSGLPQEEFAAFRMPANRGFASQVAQAGELLWCQDVTAGAAHIPTHDEYGMKAMLGIPLYVEDGLFGVLECTWDTERLVSDAERVMLQVAADRITAALVGVRRFEAASRARELEAAISAASAQLAASHDLQETVPEALEVMLEAFGCECAAFGSYRDGVLQILYGCGMEPCVVALPDHPRKHADVDGSLPVVRIEATSPSSPWLQSTLGLTEAIIVPVRVRGEWFGALLFGRRTSADGFDPLLDEYARRFSAILSLAYANARDFDAEHHIAETLQESLLHLEVQVPGIRYAHHYRSSTLATRVGGDFYDVFEMGHGLVGVLVGDVSGKGLDAAVLTTLVKYTMRAFTLESSSPAEIVARANAVLAGPTRMRDFASVFLVVLDPTTGAGTYCRAGHPPSLLIRGTGDVVVTEHGSPVIGAFADLEYHEHPFHLEKGDLLVLLTDGVTEARDADGGFFGEERLLAAASRLAGHHPAQVIDAIDQEVRTFTGGRFTDDVAMIVLTRS